MAEIIAIYQIPLGHPSLEGHFPGNPVIPGVVIIEKVLHTISQEKSSSNYKIAMAKFLQPLIPPATMTVHLSENAENRFNYKVMTETDVISNGIIEINPEINV